MVSIARSWTSDIIKRQMYFVFSRSVGAPFVGGDNWMIIFARGEKCAATSVNVHTAYEYTNVATCRFFRTVRRNNNTIRTYFMHVLKLMRTQLGCTYESLCGTVPILSCTRFYVHYVRNMPIVLCGIWS